MRGRWVASTVALLALLALAPGALAGDPLSDCTTVNVAITGGVGTSTTVCPDQAPRADPDLSGAVALVEQAVEDALGQAPELPEPSPPGAPAPPDTNASACGDERGVGLDISVDGKRSYACASGDVETPSYPGWPSPGEPERSPCPEGTNGTIVTVGTTRAGICLLTVARAPDNVLSGLSVSTEACEFANGQEGHDPRVQVGDGGVIVCAAVILEPGDEASPPPVEADLSPCSAQSIDPSITIEDGGLWLCIQYQVDP